ncbi:hypothetical protein ACOSP7_005116 [Xanthoceras sorbifolium]
MWVQLHNLPLACMSREVGQFLGEMIDKVIEVYSGSSGDYLAKFVRVRVLVDVGKSFRRALRVIVGDPEEVCMVLLKYERMPNLCYYCRKASHLVRECCENVNTILDEFLLRFGSWMSAIGFVSSRPRGGRNFRSESDESNRGKEHSDPNPHVQAFDGGK